MPLSYLRRPLCLLLISYVLLLSLLHAWGAFRILPPAAWDRWTRRRSVRLEVQLVSGFAPKRFAERVRVRILGVWNRQAPSREDAFVYLPRGQDAAALRPGQRLEIVGRLRRPRWPRLPGEFDEQGFCSDKGIGFIIDAERWKLLDRSVPWRRFPWALAETVHRSIHAMLNERLPGAEAALWEGLLLGYLGPLPSSIRQDIQDAGVMHLLVPSGAKMAVVLGACLWIASRLGLGSVLEACACAGIGGLYALAVGAEPPYLRAYACALIALAARPLERDLLGFQAVLLSAASMLVVSPRELFSAGFQMTYAAMAGILIALPRWRIPAGWPPFLHLPIRLAMMSLVVQLSLLPLLARIFGRLSAAGLLANAVLVPLDGALMGAGFLAWLLGACGLAVAGPLLSPLGRVFAGLCGAFAALPGAAWDARPLGWMGETAFYLAAFGFFALPQWNTAMKAWTAAAGLALLSTFGNAHWTTGVLFLERGGRSAAVVVLPGREGLVAGSTFGESELAKALFSAGIGRWRAAKRPPAAFQYGSTRVEFGGGMTLVSGRFRQFCILHASLPLPRLRNAPDQCEMRSTRREGAVWIGIDDHGSTLETQRELYSIGRSLL